MSFSTAEYLSVWLQSMLNNGIMTNVSLQEFYEAMMIVYVEQLTGEEIDLKNCPQLKLVDYLAYHVKVGDNYAFGLYKFGIAMTNVYDPLEIKAVFGFGKFDPNNPDRKSRQITLNATFKYNGTEFEWSVTSHDYYSLKVADEQGWLESLDGFDFADDDDFGKWPTEKEIKRFKFTAQIGRRPIYCQVLLSNNHKPQVSNGLGFNFVRDTGFWWSTLVGCVRDALGAAVVQLGPGSQLEGCCRASSEQFQADREAIDVQARSNWLDQSDDWLGSR